MEFLIEKSGGGYQKEQVDAYVRELRQAYQKMYEAYQMAYRQYEALEQRYSALQQQMVQIPPQAGIQYPGYPTNAAYGTPYGAPGTMPPYGTPGGWY